MRSEGQDCLGDRMKAYEGAEAQRRFMPLLPVVVRLDGRCFSSYTRALIRPFDADFHDIMVRVTVGLVAESRARVGYTQSDEITLVLYETDPKTEPYFGGRIQKVVSSLAAHAANVFNIWAPGHGRLAGVGAFDCRAWNVPTLREAANAVLWRELDATKNSISMAAREVYSHKALHQKGGREMQEMLFQKGINWNDYPAEFKRGTFVRRTRTRVPFTTDEIDALPPKHFARTNPDLVVERVVITKETLPSLRTLTNIVETLFFGDVPEVRGE